MNKSNLINYRSIIYQITLPINVLHVSTNISINLSDLLINMQIRFKL
jgi:hypothetical protein